jgi:hypothetical protein
MTIMRRLEWMGLLAAIVAALAMTSTISACGDDDDGGCGYVFSSVPSEGDCISLEEEFDCGSSVYNSNEDTCQLGGCLICNDIDTDWDGDLDFDS